MNNEKKAKAIIEEILGYKIPDNNFISSGRKRNTINNENNTSKTSKKNITKFSELPVEIDKNIIEFMGYNKNPISNILKYGEIDKTRLERFGMGTENEYGKALQESIIYDAEDISKSMFIDKTTGKYKYKIDTNNIQKIRFETKTLPFEIFLEIIKKKDIDKNKLKSLEIIYNGVGDSVDIKVKDMKSVIELWDFISNKKEYDISPIFEYIKYLEVLNVDHCEIKQTNFDFKNLKHIKLNGCKLENEDVLNTLKNIESFIYNGKISYGFDRIKLLKNISFNNTLKKFKLSQYTLNDGGFQYLQNLEELECHYDVSRKINGELKYLSNIKKLKLSFKGNITDIDDYVLLPKYMTKLNYLYFELGNYQKNQTHTPQLITKTLGKYESITKYKQFCGCVEASDYSGLINLKYLKLVDVIISNNEFKYVKNFPMDKIEKLYITEYGGDKHNTGKMISGFTGLKKLHLGSLIKDKYLIPILPSIEDLYINGGWSTNDILDHMDNIKTLTIYQCDRIDDDGIIDLLDDEKIKNLIIIGSLSLTPRILEYIEKLDELVLEECENIGFDDVIEFTDWDIISEKNPNFKMEIDGIKIDKKNF